MHKPIVKMLATSCALAGLFSLAPAHAAKLTAVTFGGAYEAAVQQAYFTPFSKENGTEFHFEAYDGGLAKLAAMVQANNTTWDIIDIESNDAIAACDEGLLMKLDPALLGDTSDFIPGSVSDCAVASMVWSTVFAYDKSKVGSEPSLINDFFDTQKIPGKRGVRKSPKGILEWALMADGVAKEDVYAVLGTPAGADRALKKLDSIKKDIIWWESGAQAPQLLADGAVVMTQAYNGRILDAIQKDGKPFVIVWDAQQYDYEWWGVPKGSKNAKQAFEFLAYASKPEVISQLSRYIAYAPPRTKALPHIEAETLKNLPTAPENFGNALQVDSYFWTDHFDSINKRFQVWLTKS
jgi:putative spermidine/putrescine transport system substrate-binding protein